MQEKHMPTWRIIARNGLLGGALTFYVSVIGMVETFSARNLISTFFSLGDLLLISGPILAGLLTARALVKDHDRSTLPIFGFLAGIVSNLPQVFLIWITLSVNLREVFVNISPALIELLTFGQGPALGSAIILLLGALIGGFGTLFVVLSARLWHAILNGLAVTLIIGLFSENVGQIITNTLETITFGNAGRVGRMLTNLLFTNKALKLGPAVIIFAIAFGLAYFQTHKVAQKRWEGYSPPKQKQYRLYGMIMLGVLLLLLPQLVGIFLSQALFLVGLFIIMGLGLNVVVGFAGLLDLGYVAFYAFGAYTVGLLTTTGSLASLSLSFWVALPIAVVVGVLFGVLLGFPVLRMRGDYLAIVTLGFGEIIRILALSDWLKPFEGGAQGVLHIPPPQIFNLTLDGPEKMYYLVVAGILVAIFVTTRLRSSRLGRQWEAMREDEDVAEAMGINLIQTKLLAFAIGAGFSALAGGILAVRLGNIFPHSFALLISINALSLIIVGGMGSIPGVLVGSFILVGLPEILREFAEYRLLLYGVLLIVMMLVRPEGFLPESRRQQEFHQEEGEVIEAELQALGEEA